MTTTTTSSPAGADFDLTRSEREQLLDRLAATLERFLVALPDLSVAPPATIEEVRAEVAAQDLESGADPQQVLDRAADLLTRYAVHVPHPRYFGLFNPAPTFMGVLGDALAAVFNPQLGAWSHAPAAVEMERTLVRFLAGRLGLPGSAAGSFTSGGAEANHTGVLVALTAAFPDLARAGLRGLDGQPTFYASEESHHTWIKVARATGLGEAALRIVPAGPDLRMDLTALARMIAADRAAGHLPFLVAATAGTTSAGAIDPLPELADLAVEERLHLHVDAAWAGAAALSDRLRPLLDGIEGADSVTLDAHKWLSVPIGAGVLLGPDPELLRRTFKVTAAYMPADASEAIDPYATSMQWSRRFIGLKLYLSLAAAGRAGYARQLEHDCHLGDLLRERLTADGWTIVNDTALPLVCFADGDDTEGAPDATPARLDRIADTVVARGRAWISSTRLRGRPALRACITSHRTTEDDLDVLVAELAAARETEIR